MVKQTSWGAVASWYDEHLEGEEDTYHTKVILPHLLRLLDLSGSEVVIDLACGQGFFSRAFKEKGAKVTGVDISPELIAIAKNKGPASIRYEVSPAHKLSFLQNNSVDVVVIVLAIQNIAELTETFAECSRILKRQGRLLFVLNHPAFRIPGKSSWGFDEEKTVQYRRVDGYLSSSSHVIDMQPGAKASKKETTLSFHRSLQDYMKALAKNGLAITRLEEWISHRKSQKGVRQKAEDMSRKEIPLFMCIEAKQV